MMRSPSPHEITLVRRLFSLLLAAYVSFGAYTLTDSHEWGDDWAQYVLHARNLVNGTPYAETGYLFNPDVPYVGPAAYGPGVPLLLAPVIAVAGADISSLKLVGLACTGLTIALIPVLFAPIAGPIAAYAAAGLTALHPVIWGQRQLIQSEAPYALFSLLALVWAMRRVELQSARTALLDGVILGLLVCACVACRTIGVVLVPALIVFGWSRGKPMAWFAGFVLTLLLSAALQLQLAVAPPIYQAEMKAPTISMVASKPDAYLYALADLFPLPLGLSPVAAVLFAIACAAGIAFACARPLVRERSTGLLQGLASRVPLVAWYAAAYCGALVVASVAPTSRLLTPLLPLLIPFALLGILVVALRLTAPLRGFQVGGIAVAVYFLALQASGRFTPDVQMATCPECREMFAFVGENTEVGSVIVFNKPRAMALLGSRASWRSGDHYSLPELKQRLERVRATHAVVGVPGGEFARRFPAGAALDSLIRSDGSIPIFRNKGFVVVRLPAGSATK